MIRIVLALCLAFVLTSRAVAAAPFYDSVYDVQTTSNIVYGTGPTMNGAMTKDLTLDLYQPVQVVTPLPTESPAIVLVHGGGFIGGDKVDMAPLAQQYASLGYVVASINYRLYGDLPPNSSPGPADNFTPPPAGYDTFPDLLLGGNAINAAVQDANAAIGWMRDNAATYNVTADRVGIGGVSAGAITSLLVGYNDLPTHYTPTVVLDFLGSMYGTEDVIHAGGPPAFMFHGTLDTQVPFDGDVAVANQLEAVGVYHEFYQAVGLGHVLSEQVFALQFGDKTLLQHNIEFLANHLVPEPASLVLASVGGIALLFFGRTRAARRRR